MHVESNSLTDSFVLNLTSHANSTWNLPLFSLKTVSIATILVSINLLTLIGNSLVILAVATTPRLQNVTNFYVSSLAVCDLLIGIAVLPCGIWFELTDGYWSLGAVACKVWLSIDILLSTASILNLCIISVDRYLAITRPLGYATRRSIPIAIGMVVSVWVVSTIITIPPILGWTEHNWTGGQCSPSLHPGYRVYSALGSFFVPFCVMLFVYFNIFLVARRRRHLLAPQRGPSLRRGLKMMAAPSRTRATARRALTGVTVEEAEELAPASPNPDNEIDDDELSSDFETQADNNSVFQHNHVGGDSDSNARQKHNPRPKITQLQRLVFKSGSLGHITNFSTKYANVPTPAISADSRALKAKREKLAFRREHKAAKTLAGVVGCFSLCWLPFFVTYLYEAVCWCVVESKLFSCVIWLGYTNSVFNPFIYAFYNKEYAKAFRRILKRLKCCGTAHHQEFENSAAPDRVVNKNPIFLYPTSTNNANATTRNL